MTVVDLWFPTLPVAERMRIFDEAEREADLDALRGRCLRSSAALSRAANLGVAVYAAAALLRDGGELDWRGVVAALVGEADARVACEVIERMARERAEPGVAAAKESV